MTDTLDKSNMKTKQSQEKPRRSRKAVTLGGGMTSKDYKPVTYTGSVGDSVEWDKLKAGKLFSERPDGLFPQFKDSISSAWDLRTGQRTVGIIAGMVYPIVL